MLSSNTPPKPKVFLNVYYDFFFFLRIHAWQIHVNQYGFLPEWQFTELVNKITWRTCFCLKMRKNYLNTSKVYFACNIWGSCWKARVLLRFLCVYVHSIDETEQDQQDLRQRKAEIARCWIKYCLNLLQSARKLLEVTKNLFCSCHFFKRNKVCFDVCNGNQFIVGSKSVSQWIIQ